MKNLRLEQRDWVSFFDHVSRAHAACKVTIEVDSEIIGAQKEVENAVLHGLSYDPKGSAIAIRAGAVEHMIAHPASVGIAHTGTDLICMEVTGADKTRHLFTFLPPVHLPDLLPPASC